MGILACALVLRSLVPHLLSACGNFFTRKPHNENFSVKGVCGKINATSEPSRISVGSPLLPVEISVMVFPHGPRITESSRLMWT